MDIEKLLEEKSSIVNKELERVFSGNIPNLYDAVNYHLETGGKRIRPILALLTCEALGGNSKKVLPFAAACEILHNWLLVHDDIEDGDKVRRDKPAMWVKYGLAHGVNAGDLMAQKVYEAILSSDLDDKTVVKLMEAMVTASVKTAEGQAMDINLRQNNEPSEDDYMATVIGKTAYYLSVPMVGGAIVAGSDNVIKALEEFGRNAGPAFQIADDLLDLTEGKGRGEIGCDIKEGKRSILVVHCLSKCDIDEKARLLDILNKPKEETSSEEVLWVKELFEKHGSVDYARKKSQELVEKAKASIKGLPKELRDMLNYFADYLIERKK
jgi:geranylgeranyl diphosphate synthase type I